MFWESPAPAAPRVYVSRLPHPSPPAPANCTDASFCALLEFNYTRDFPISTSAFISPLAFSPVAHQKTHALPPQTHANLITIIPTHRTFRSYNIESKCSHTGTLANTPLITASRGSPRTVSRAMWRPGQSYPMISSPLWRKTMRKTRLLSRRRVRREGSGSKRRRRS